MNDKTLKDSEILDNVINALGLSAHSISLKLDYKSPASVYHVINGVNSLSEGMIDRIVKVFPNVSMDYLKNGRGSVLLTGNELQTQMNVLNTHVDPEIEFVKKLVSVPGRIDKIEIMLKDILDRMNEKEE